MTDDRDPYDAHVEDHEEQADMEDCRFCRRAYAAQEDARNEA